LRAPEARGTLSAVIASAKGARQSIFLATPLHKSLDCFPPRFARGRNDSRPSLRGASQRRRGNPSSLQRFSIKVWIASRHASLAVAMTRGTLSAVIASAKGARHPLPVIARSLAEATRQSIFLHHPPQQVWIASAPPRNDASLAVAKARGTLSAVIASAKGARQSTFLATPLHKNLDCFPPRFARGRNDSRPSLRGASQRRRGNPSSFIIHRSKSGLLRLRLAMTPRFGSASQ